MFKKLNETVKLKDNKGKEYKFEMYLYDSMDAVEEAVKNFKKSGLYIFAKRVEINGEVKYDLAYIGETGDYSTRGYKNHHKREQIDQYESNEFGVHLLEVSEEKRLEIEANLIETNDSPCNK